MNTYSIGLDLIKSGPLQTVTMRQHDHRCTTIVARVYEHGQAITTSGLTARMVMAYPDKSGHYAGAATYSDGTITHVVDERQACNIAGRTDKAYFELTDQSGRTFSTQSFAVVILPSGTDGMSNIQS